MRNQRHTLPKKPNQRNNSKRVSAKTLAFEFGTDAHTVCVILRARYRANGNDHGKPWIWDKGKELAEVRRYLTRVLEPTEKPSNQRKGSL